MGHPLPIFNGLVGANGHKWNGGLVNHRTILVGDAGNFVDPLLGEGIYFAIWSGQLVAENIMAVFRNPNRQFEEYKKSVKDEFGLEFLAASRMSRIIYGLPRNLHYWAGKIFSNSYQRVLQRYCEVL